MKTYYYEFEADENFYPGYCEKCPFHYEQEFYDEDDGYDFTTCCSIMQSSVYDEQCPLKEK